MAGDIEKKGGMRFGIAMANNYNDRYTVLGINRGVKCTPNVPTIVAL